MKNTSIILIVVDNIRLELSSKVLTTLAYYTYTLSIYPIKAIFATGITMYI
jgi:hypothetical protein